jgi:RNA-binding protein
MTTKQRAYLKRLAMTIEPVYQIGKSALTPEITQGVSDVLEARELIKINILKNCMADIKDIALILSERTHSEVVQIIGKKIILYRESKEKKKIVLPADKKLSRNMGK